MIQLIDPPSSAPLVPDRDYCWEFVEFSVESTLIRVPVYRFVENSDIFTEKYLTQCTRDGSQSYLTPIPLDIALSDFLNFLKALYPRARNGSVDLSKDGWVAVLKLSTLWSFNELRKQAIDRLSSECREALTPFERIQLARSNKIPSWLVSAYVELVERPQIITVDEAALIDEDRSTAVQLYAIIVKRMRSNACSSGKEVQPLETEVRETFSVELETLWREEKQYLMGNGNEEEASRRYAQNEEKLPQEAYATQLIPVAGKGLVAEAQSQSTGGEDEQNPSNVDGSTATKQGNNDLQEDTKLITDIEASVLQGLQKQKERLRDENSRRIKFIKKKYKQPADNSVREEKLNVVGRRSKIEEEIFKRFEQVLCKVPSEQDQEDRTEKVQNGQDEKRDEISGGRVG